MIPLCLLFAAVLQDPAPQPPAARALDVIELKNGETLQGRILTEVDGFLELELAAGAAVGFPTAQIAAIRRGAAVPPPVAMAVTPRNEWFVLHDATGAAVGWLASSVTRRDDGGFAVNEEYEFQHGVRRYQITSLAIADGNGAPASAYFRERISEPVFAAMQLPMADAGAMQERVLGERIVEAKVVGGALQVQRLDRTGRNERQLAWPADASFPLLARTLARAATTGPGAANLFDPATEEMVVRHYEGARRRSLVLDGKAVQVTEVAETTPNGRNAEWVDATAHTLRREIAGPALVAVPSSSSSCKLAVGTTTIGGAVVGEAGGRFGMWLPNPAWTAREGLPAGQIVFDAAPQHATLSLSRIDHLEPGTSLDAAAEAVRNWFLLLQPGLAVVRRESGSVRERATVRWLLESPRVQAGQRALVEILPHQDHWLVLVCLAPIAAWDELVGDFEFARRSLELEPQSLSPKLQGPIAERATRQKRATTPVRGSTSNATAAGSAPVVRVPKQD